jgi:hypothetical protein
MITVNGNTMYAPGCPSYNELISGPIDIGEQSGLTEPVTVQDHKDYMRLEGWAGETSEATEFSFDDDLIAELNMGARQYIEQTANVSLIPHELEVVLTNAGNMELPMSPIDSIVSVLNSEGDAVDTDNILTVGNDRKRLKSPTGSELTVSYTTSALKDQRPLTDIKRLVAALYDNRGMTAGDIASKVNLLISSYSRKNPVA